jgi:glycosyltransferase involved in cell wall biosynthesis
MFIMANEPLVSVVMPAYNSRQYIDAAIDSLLAQTHPHLEIIVVDDGSTDGTGDFVQTQYGEQVRLIRQTNMGPSVARNRGIAEAQGAYIQFLDADDLLLPEKIERCLAIFAEKPALGVVYTTCRFVDADGSTPLDRAIHGLVPGDVFCSMLTNYHHAIMLHAALIRRSALLAVGGLPDNPKHRCAEDLDMFLRLANAYEFAGIDEPLVVYRKHGNEITKQRYCMAHGRLLTIQKARHYAKRQHCLTDAEYDVYEAGRWHMLAQEAWRNGDRQEARNAFQEAIQLTSQSAGLRRIYEFMTYLFPVEAMFFVNNLLDSVKRLR